VKTVIQAAADRAYPAAVRLRRLLHRFPELSTKEFRTAKTVSRFIAQAGLSPRLCIDATGVSAVLRNGRGKTVVLRADLDALPIEEKTGVTFRSVNKGVMHACGHDMHAACLAGAAQVLLSLKDRFRGTVVFLFQPSEEAAPGGASAMIRQGIFPDGVDAVFGLHVNPQHARGTVGLKSGHDYAGVLDFDVVVRGKGSHGAMPQESIDPIVCSSAIILLLQTLVSRECAPYEPSVVTVGTIAAGTKRNVIPEEARFCGTLRAFSERHLAFLGRRVSDVVRRVSASFGARATVTLGKAYPPGYNDPVTTARAYRALSSALGPGRVIRHTHPTMLAEDFSYYQKKAPGVFVHLGVRPPAKRSVPGVHSPYFLPDEGAIRTGITVLAALAIDILKS
jgi:amidohydrolase